MYEKISFVVSGRVQGVCFRACARDAALGLDVTGWVRNTADGRVEGEACGSGQSLDAFIEWLKKGPSHARVDNLDVERQGAREDRSPSFDIRY